MAGPLDYLINQQMPANLAKVAQQNIGIADKQISQFNTVARGVTSPMQAAINKPSVSAPNTFQFGLSGTPNISIGSPVQSYSRQAQSGSQVQTPSDWRFQSFHDAYGAHDQTSAISPAHMQRK